MHEKELREHAMCSKCEKPIGHTGLPMFWTVHINRHGLKLDALRRQQGLTMMLGGSAALASVMGPNEDMTTILCDRSVTLCEECAMPIMELLESCNDENEAPGLEVGDD